MKLTILGCSGGIGSGQRTTSLLLDHDILIDAGTGVQDLSVDQLAQIDHVFLTHSHLDHISSLPLIVDSVGSLRDRPVQVHALPETISALKEHIFNWTIWPDFTENPHYDSPAMVFVPVSVDETVQLNNRGIRALQAIHTVPALGYHLSGPDGSLVFSGDTGPNPDFWRYVNGVTVLEHLIVETAFSNREQDLAVSAKHLFPIQLSEELEQLHRQPKLWITHLKPSDRETIEREVATWARRFNPHVLQTGQVLEF